MASRMRQVVLALLSGLTFTLALAWLAAWLLPLESMDVSGRTTTSPPGVTWTLRAVARQQDDWWGIEPAGLLEDDMSLYGWTLSRGLYAGERRITGRAGWPWPALQFDCDFAPPATNSAGGFTSTTSTIQTVRWGWSPAGKPAMDLSGRLVKGVLPMQPIWSGLIADTALIGAALWLLAAAVRAVRRVRRVRAGLCPMCRYNMRGSTARCLECGWVVAADAAGRAAVTARLARLAMILVLAATTTIGVSWAAAIGVTYRDAEARFAWLGEVPTPWLVGRVQAPASSRVAWIYNVAEAQEYAANFRARERLLARQERGEAEMSAQRITSIIDARTERLVSQRGDFAPVNSGLAPWWAGAAPEPSVVLYSGNQWRSIVKDGRGWPLPAMQVQFRSDLLAVGAVSGGLCDYVLGGIMLSDAKSRHWRDVRAVPLQIIWPGFAIDTAVYAMLYAMLAWVLAGMRRRLRRAG